MRKPSRAAKAYASKTGLEHVDCNVFRDPRTTFLVYILSDRNGKWFGITKNIWENCLKSLSDSSIILLRGNQPPLRVSQPTLKNFIGNKRCPSSGHWNINLKKATDAEIKLREATRPVNPNAEHTWQKPIVTPIANRSQEKETLFQATTLHLLNALTSHLKLNETAPGARYLHQIIQGAQKTFQEPTRS